MNKLQKYKIFYLVVSLLFLPLISYSANRYVKTNGNNSASGTNWAEAWKTIQYAADNVVAGDTVYIREGVYFEQVKITNKNGTSINPIKFTIDTNYGIGSVIINNSICLNLNNTAHIIITNIVCKGDIIINSSYSNQIIDNLMTNTLISLNYSKDIVIKKIKLNGNNNYNTGIYLSYCTNIFITDNEIENCEQDSSSTGTVTIRWYCNGIFIERNRIINSMFGVDRGNAISIEDFGDEIRINFNTISNSQQYDIWIHNTIGSNIEIYNNNIYDKVYARQRILKDNWWGTTIADQIKNKISSDNSYSNFTPYRLFGPFDISTNSDTISPVIVTNLKSNITSETIWISWNKNGDLDFDHYNIYRSSIPGTKHLSKNEIILKTISTNIFDIPGNGTWYYHITASDNYNIYTNESWYSEEIKVTIGTSTNVHNITQDKWYYTIMEAVNEATNSDLLHVYPGTYNESIIISPETTLANNLRIESVSWISNNDNSNTIIDANNIFDMNIEIKNGCRATINGFTIENGINYNIVCSDSSNINLKNNIIENGPVGINLLFVSSLTLVNNVVKNCYQAIRAYATNINNFFIINNSFISNNEYIYFQGLVLENTIISNNIFTGGMGAIYLSLYEVDNLKILNNKFISVANCIWDWDDVSSKNLIIKENIFTNCSIPMFFWGAVTNFAILNNKFYNDPNNNWGAINFSEISNLKIHNNYFYSNSFAAIQGRGESGLRGVNDFSIISNTFYKCPNYSIYIEFGEGIVDSYINNIRINNNNFKECGKAIYIENSVSPIEEDITNVLIAKNIISNIIWNGIIFKSKGIKNIKNIDIISNYMYNCNGKAIGWSGSAKNIKIIKNQLLNNNIGIGGTCSDSYIINNLFCNNTNYGVTIIGSGNIVQKNIFISNENGMLLNCSSSTIVNNVIYNNNQYGIKVDSFSGKINNNITRNNGTAGIYSTPSLSFNYCCVNDGFGGNALAGIGTITNNPLFKDETSSPPDFHLRYNSPCLGSGSSNIVPTSMGVYPAYVYSDDSGTNQSTTYKVFFTTSYGIGSIPQNGKIEIEFPPGFDISGLNGTNPITESYWGGSAGTFSASVIGQKVIITRSGGNNSTAGQTENLILTPVINPVTVGTEYSVIITTKDNSDNVIERMTSNDFQIVIPPAAPTGFIGNVMSKTSIRWSWQDNAFDEIGYYVHDNDHNNISTNLGVNATNFIEIGLNPNTCYTRHANVFKIGCGIDSLSDSKYTFANPPTNLSNNYKTDSTVSLIWDGNGATRFGIERANDIAGSPGPWVEIVNWASNLAISIYTNKGLSSLTPYWYRVKGYNGNGIETFPSNQTCITTLNISTPSNFIGNTISVTSIRWSWKDNSIQETNYAVRNIANFNVSPLLGIDATNWIETGLSPNTCYTRHCYVWNENGGCKSGDDILYTFANPPFGLVLNIPGTNIVLNWSSGSGGAACYMIEKSLDNITYSTLKQWIDNWNITSFTDYTVNPDTQYYYCVRSYNGDEIVTEGGNTNSILTVPAVPTGFIATSLSSNMIKWKWKDNSTSETNYIVCNNAGSNISGLLGVEATNWVETNLSPNTCYTRFVKVLNPAGTSQSSNAKAFTHAKIPIGLQIDKALATSIALQWSNSGSTRYAIERADNSGGSPTNWAYIMEWNDGLSVSSYTNKGLDENTIYWYRIRGYNGDGIITLSGNEISGKTLDITPPAVPTDLKVSSINAEVNIRWKANTEPDFARYNIYRSITSGSGYSLVASISNINQTSWTNRDMELGHRYYYVLTSVDTNNNESGYSEEVSEVPVEIKDGEVVIEKNYFKGEDDIDTSFNFRLKKAGQVTIKLYRLDGRLIDTIIDEYMETGDKQIYWRMKGEQRKKLGSSVYLVQVITPEFTKIVKVVIFKK